MAVDVVLLSNGLRSSALTHSPQVFMHVSVNDL